MTIAGRSADKLQRAVKHLGDVRGVAADITNQTDVQALFDALDSVDHVFVSAGQAAAGPVIDTDIDRLRFDVSQRFWGLIHVVREAAPRMTGGSITGVSGQLGSRPAAGVVVTSAMNAAVEALAKGLALELAPIRVNAVAPGLTDTPLLGDSRDQAAAWATGTLPVGRIGRAEEVAQAVMLLMSNDYITGEVLHVDGGGRYV